VAGDDSDAAKRTGDIADDMWMVVLPALSATSTRSLGANVRLTARPQLRQHGPLGGRRSKTLMASDITLTFPDIARCYRSLAVLGDSCTTASYRASELENARSPKDGPAWSCHRVRSRTRTMAACSRSQRCFASSPQYAGLRSSIMIWGGLWVRSTDLRVVKAL
jgi:hypothetical protein